jgi:multidrug resistance protein MdtO
LRTFEDSSANRQFRVSAGAATQNRPRQSFSTASLVSQLLKEELAPYPGRTALDARMMIPATLAMLISMTFRMPEGAYGASFALTLSRESPRATVAAAKTLAIAFVIAGAYELIGAIFFVNEPILRLVWVCGTFL